MNDTTDGHHPEQLGDTEQQQQLWAQLQRTQQALRETISNLQPDTPGDDRMAWELEMAQNRVASVTERPLAQVAAEHGLRAGELIEQAHGKRVLIIGPGNSSLAAELLEADDSTDITSIDIDESSLGKQPGTTILASGDTLPLDDRQYDDIFMTYSLPTWAMSTRQARQALDEAVRVLAPEGTLYVAPVSQARLRLAASSQGAGTASRPGIETDPRFRSILCEIDIAAIDWLQAAAVNPSLAVTLTWSLPYEDDFGGVMAATIRRVA